MKNAKDQPFIKDEQTKRAIVAILLAQESTPKSCVYLAVIKGAAAVQKMACAEFAKQFMPLGFGDDLGPERWAREMVLTPKVKFTGAALDHLERILDMGTRGMSAEEIHEEVVALATQLPVGHALCAAIPPSYKDRAAAIQALTAIRHEVFISTTKEKSMATKAVKGAKVETEAEKEARVKAEAEAAEAAKKNKGGKKAAAKAAPASSKAASAAPKDDGKAAKEPKEKKARKGAVDLTGPFKIGGDRATKAKTPEELGLHEGSARYKLMTHVFKHAKERGAKGFTAEELGKVCGDQLKQALGGMVRYGFLVKVG